MDSPEDYNLDEVVFVELEVQVTRTEKVVFATFPDPIPMGTSGQPNRQVGGFLREMNYWMHSVKSLVKGEKVAVSKWRFLDHTVGCDRFKNPDGTYIGPNEDPHGCGCWLEHFNRCERGSLNGRRKR